MLQRFLVVRGCDFWTIAPIGYGTGFAFGGTLCCLRSRCATGSHWHGIVGSLAVEKSDHSYGWLKRCYLVVRLPLSLAVACTLAEHSRILCQASCGCRLQLKLSASHSR